MSPMQEVKDPELMFYLAKLKAVNLGLSDFQGDMVMDFLTNIYSGYQQLTDVLCDRLLKGRKAKGTPVPIDNIKASYHYFYNAKHDTDIPFFDIFRDQDVLKEAFLFRWQEKNPGSRLKTFDEIAPLLTAKAGKEKGLVVKKVKKAAPKKAAAKKISKKKK
jgi:hypothetical protein